MKTKIVLWIGLLLLACPVYAQSPTFDAISFHDQKTKTPASQLLKVEGERLEITATGRESYFGQDDGTFAYVKTDATAWRFTARVKSIDMPEGQNAKYGIAVRAGTTSFNRGLLVRYDCYEGNQAIQWLHRYHVAYSASDGGRRTMKAGVEKEMAKREGFWLRMEYSYPTITAFYSEDGEKWSRIATKRSINMLEHPLYVGLMVTGGGDGKTPIKVTYDHVKFEELETKSASLSPGDFKEYKPLMPMWDMYVAYVKSEEMIEGEATYMLMKPRDLEWKDVKAIFYSTSSKEIIQQKDDGSLTMLKYKKGAGRVRIPQEITQKSDTLYEIRPKPMYRMFKENGWVHLATAVKPHDVKFGLPELAKITGYPIQNLPMFVEGGSFAGAHSSTMVELYTEKVIAASPGIIGVPSWPVKNPKVLKVPQLFSLGTHDGPHLKIAQAKDQPIRQAGGLWAMQPMRWLYHDWGNTYSLSFPYFEDVQQLRVPVDADPTQSMVKLKEIKEEDGWIALGDTVESNFPEVIPWAKATEDQRRGHNWWLPTERTARLWQSGSSNWSETVIHFPRFDHTVGWGASLNKPENLYHQMKANQPFNLMASGPMGDDVEVTYYADLKPLKVLKRYNDNPYLVQLEGLPQGTHNIYAITKIGDQKEISRSQMIYFNGAE